MKFHSSFQKNEQLLEEKEERYVMSLLTPELSSLDFKWLFAKRGNSCGIWKHTLAGKGS